jgi:hypothetical protein
MHHFLRELAKIAVGLFIADLVGVIWFGAAGFFPLTILGVTWTASSILPIAVFDAAVILLLIHLGWNTKLPVRSPSERGLLSSAGAIFLAVALIHLARLAFGWSVALGSFAVPLWLSWVGVIVAGYLSYASFHFAFRRKA